MASDARIHSLLNEIYSTPKNEASFTSAGKLQKVLIDKFDERTPLNKIQDWLNGQRTYSLHRRRLVSYPRNVTLASDIDAQWQADLCFLPDLSKFNDGIKIILLCIDVVSRYGWCEPIRDKTGTETTRGMRAILQRAHPRKPIKLQTDDGREFFNKNFQKLMTDYDVNHFSTKSDKKAALAERLIRTMKEKVYRYLDNKPGNNRYLEDLQDLMTSYNNTYHETIRMPPASVDETTLGRVLWYLYGHLWVSDVADMQRVSKESRLTLNDQLTKPQHRQLLSTARKCIRDNKPKFNVGQTV
jgi:hypothetical protein